MKPATPIPIDVWIPRFVTKLRYLTPALAESEVIAAALYAYHEATDIEPEEAAEMYAYGPPQRTAPPRV